MQVFLSYGRKDLDVLPEALEMYLGMLDSLLAARGMGKLFRDTKDLQEYGEWRTDLGQAIDRSYAVVALVSNAWLGSDVCWQEFLHATQSAKKPRVFPIIYDIPDPMPQISPRFRQHWPTLKELMESRTNHQWVEWSKNRRGLYHELLAGGVQDRSLAGLCEPVVNALRTVLPTPSPPIKAEQDHEWPNVVKANALMKTHVAADPSKVPQFRRVDAPSQALGDAGASTTLCYATSHARTVGEWKRLLGLTDRETEALCNPGPIQRPGNPGLAIISEQEWRAMIDQAWRDQTLTRAPLSEIVGQFVGEFQLPILDKPELILVPGARPGDPGKQMAIWFDGDSKVTKQRVEYVPWKSLELRLVFRASSGVG